MTIIDIIAVILIFAGAITSQKLAANAYARLDDVTKLRLADIFPKRNANYAIIVFSLIIAMLLATYFFPYYRAIILLVYGILFLAYFVFKMAFNVRTLRAISAPSDYISSIRTSFTVFISGAVLGIGIIAFEHVR